MHNYNCSTNPTLSSWRPPVAGQRIGYVSSFARKLTLRTLDVPEGTLTEETIARERREMQEMRYGPNNRNVTGAQCCGNHQRLQQRLALRGSGRALFTAEWNLHLSQWICGPLKNERPHTASARLLQEALVWEPLALA